MLQNKTVFAERFKGQVALVTGAASGIGKAIAQRLAAEGAMLILMDLQTVPLAKIADELTKQGTKVCVHTIDITDEEAVNDAIMSSVGILGKLDVVVHAAGVVGPTATPITAFDYADFEKVLRINLIGSFVITKCSINVMEPQEYGRILLLASIAGKEGNPGMVGYSASKAGVIGLVKGVAKEYANKGITVNGLAPAVIKTAMNADTAPEQLAYMTAKIPMGRLGEVEEAAAMATFIVSVENSFSTGFIYDLSGGRATY